MFKCFNCGIVINIENDNALEFIDKVFGHQEKCPLS